MQRDIEFSRLVNVMWNGTREWHDIDRHIRQMNKKLAQWRRAGVERGVTWAVTQRTAFELIMAMQAVNAIVQRPPAAAPAPEPVALPLLAWPPSPDLIRDGGNGVVMTGAFDYVADQLFAAPEHPGGLVLDVSAATA